MAGRKRHVEEEEHENHERWLVTYADMVTLLMVLFIVLFAMGKPDAEKFQALKASLAIGFGQEATVLTGGSSLLQEPGTRAVAPVTPVSRRPAPTGDDVERTVADRNAARRELARLRAIEKRIRQALRARGLRGDIRTGYDERGLVVSLVSKHVVFRSNLATLSPRGARVVDAVGPVLVKLPDRLEISGNTNQLGARPRYYATDWDLSSARAITVLRRLEERLGVETARLSVAAYGQTRPLVDPERPGAQVVNKRVDIVVLSAADATVRQLLPELAGSTDRPTAGGH
ncbi:OmpA/MotB family protein [Nocardioides deserti]|uniref:Flagellar motor protein MotB n=1 Tax=Nocardioides deserti TaxID=1588644 RepID=A0ABR6UDJ7_9ACTN|nr:flagellar motor protein MotB [Nocardioides deserti]MBC2962413.1 flagellar motor protein MotB [Nocardioides deserti]GGO77950.1 chemotaxis protein MotB [Nocardioides deserti]